jgi:hypothetical protein
VGWANKVCNCEGEGEGGAISCEYDGCFDCLGVNMSVFLGGGVAGFEKERCEELDIIY